MSEDPILRAVDITSGYGDITVLRGVNMEVREGEIITLIGPNGAGKSTLLKTIFGILKPSGGKVYLHDEDITGWKPHIIAKKGMNYVPQLDNIFPSLTVCENLEMGGYLLGDCSERVDEVIDFFPSLQDKVNARVNNLSGGQQKMVAFGRGMMLDPEILIVDEPSAGLAPQLASDVYEKIKDINEMGTAIVMVEQNARRALKLCDRGYVLDDGKNRFEGTGRELLDNEDVARLYLGGEATG